MSRLFQHAMMCDELRRERRAAFEQLHAALEALCAPHGHDIVKQAWGWIMRTQVYQNRRNEKHHQLVTTERHRPWSLVFRPGSKVEASATRRCEPITKLSQCS